MISLTLFYDCETTGLNDPHLLQISANLVTTSRPHLSVGRMTHLVKPEGWAIEPEAIDIHGITEAKATLCGAPLVLVLATFKDMVEKADQVISFNLNYDRSTIGRALFDAQADPMWWAKAARRMRCAMEEASPVLKLPGKYGDFKFPTLGEAAAYFGWESLGNLHDAEADVEVLEFVWWNLQHIGAET